MNRRQLLTLPLLLGPGCIGAATASLPTRLAALLDDPTAPLASLSVWARRRDGQVFSGQWGRRQIADGAAARDLPAAPDTLFRMASVTKLVVGLGVMRLVEAGKLDLDADLQALLGHPLRHPLFSTLPITLRLVLSHRSGIVDMDETYPGPGLLLSGLLAPDSKAWGRRPPGSFFEYCNLHYGLVAAAMERASGERFDRLMQRLVLTPLGMQGGFESADFPPEQQAQIATLYRRPVAGAWKAQVDDFMAAPIKPVLDAEQAAGYTLGANGSLYGPQGRLRTRVADLGTVAAMLLSQGRHAGKVFLEPSSVRALFTEQWRFDERAANGDSLDGEFQAWGLGVQRYLDRSRPGWGDRLAPGLRAWGHPGFAYGLHSALIVAPERGAAVAFAVGGTTVGPGVAEKGRHSSFAPWEEQLNALLWSFSLG